MSREEAVIEAFREYSSEWNNTEEAASDVLAAADAHDAAHGIHRVSLDEETVERAAQVVHNFLNKNYPCGCGPDEMCPGNSYEATHIARAVLAAAVEADQ